MDDPLVSPEGERFLIQLRRLAAEEPDAAASMYEVGLAVGLDRTQARRVAQDLIGEGLVEIKTLSGRVALTESGLKLADGLDQTPSQPARLGPGPVLVAGVPARSALEKLLAGLKLELGQLGLDFETLAEITADLRTLEAQLASPRPKTEILRAVLASLDQTLAGSGRPEARTWGTRVAALTGSP